MTAVCQYYVNKDSSLDQAALIADASNNIENWASLYRTFYLATYGEASVGYVEFGVPDLELTRRPIFLRMNDNADLSQSGDGDWTFVWGFAHQSTAMFRFWHVRLGIEAAWYKDLTVQTIDDFGCYRCFHARVLRPVSRKHFTPQIDGVDNVLYRFVRGVEITGGTIYGTLY